MLLAAPVIALLRDRKGCRCGAIAARVLGAARCTAAVEALSETVSDGCPMAKQTAAEALASIATEASVKALMAHLEPVAREEVAAALWGLAKCPHEKALAALLDCFGRDDYRRTLFYPVTRALAASGRPKAVDALLAHLADPKAPQRDTVAGELGLTKDPRARAATIGLLRDDTSVAVRKEAVYSLVRFGDKEALQALCAAATGDPASVVRSEALWRIELHDGSVGSLDRPLTLTAFAKVLQEDADPALRKKAIGKLWSGILLNPKPVVEAYLAALKTEKDVEIRIEILKHLTVGDEMVADKGDGPRLVKALMALLDDPEAAVANAAARALMTFRHPSVIKQVQGLLSPDNSADSQERLTRVIGRLKDAAPFRPPSDYREELYRIVQAIEATAQSRPTTVSAKHRPPHRLTDAEGRLLNSADAGAG